MYVNSSRIAAIWLETPANEPIGTQIDGDNVVGRSSAYLNVQIPFRNSTVAGFHAACSIDARWVQSQIIGFQVGDAGSDAIYKAPSFSVLDQGVFPALSNGNWRTVRLGLGWLNALTPELANNWNTLSSTFSEAGLDNKTGLITHWGDVGRDIAAIVSSIVVDGMSRSGFEKSGGFENKTLLSSNNSLPGSESLDSILEGSYELPFAWDNTGNTTSRYKIHWSVAVTGLGFKANSLAYYLAMALLFIYAVLVFGHIIWVFKTNELSTAWSSLTDLIALALKSTPPQSVLDNASAGIERFKTFQEALRIREINTQASNRGTTFQNGAVQSIYGAEMILGMDYLPSEHKMIITGKSY